MIEVLGAEGCCDGATTWSFNWNYGDWKEVTLDTLNEVGSPDYV
jgi:hypothetical protein